MRRRKAQGSIEGKTPDLAVTDEAGQPGEKGCQEIGVDDEGNPLAGAALLFFCSRRRVRFFFLLRFFLRIWGRFLVRFLFSLFDGRKVFIGRLLTFFL